MGRESEPSLIAFARGGAPAMTGKMRGEKKEAERDISK